MGQEIKGSQFESDDFKAFSERLKKETRLLCRWLEEDAFPVGENMGGFELEAWLVDRDARPATIIEPYLERLDEPLVVPELATFNLEINGTPCRLQGMGLREMAGELERTWSHCNRVAGSMDARLAMIGILPTGYPDDFTLVNMAPFHRYRALNEQVLRLRGERPLELEIEGRDRLHMVRDNVMLESATTSFQIHLKVNAAEAGRFYNASKILSAPMVAVGANSPYLFGADLWDETRIPLFEQAVAVGESESSKRVTLGVHYVQHSIAEYFQANYERYQVLLPHLMDEPVEHLAHLRLHNGTIWRWNRPLIGFDEAGTPHLRIEHRVVPAGPSVLDNIANAAFYYGAVCALARQPVAPETRLPFEQARDNFYRAARWGLGAQMKWLDGRALSMQVLCQEQLLPLARDGLLGLGVDRDEVDYWLEIIAARVAGGRNGAAWQRAWVKRNGSDMVGLTEAYLERQESGIPVHEWGM